MQLTPRSPSLWHIAKFFLRLGLTAFGGPAVHLAMMEEQAVRQLQWLTHEEFMDLLAAVNLIPGPNSTQMAIFIGRKQGGVPGLIIAGLCFILPAMLIVLGLAAAYGTYGELPVAQGFLAGVKPVMIAILIHALWVLSQKSLRNFQWIFFAVIACVASLLHQSEILVLLALGISAVGIQRFRGGPRAKNISGIGLLALFWPRREIPLAMAATAAFVSSAGPSVVRLFLYFLKIGSVLYGSGYVLLAFLQSGLVDELHWLTQAQLLDATSVGQLTPGPVFTTATFIGFLLLGLPGALAATLGIFLPSFFLVGFSGAFMARLKTSKVAQIFLQAVGAGSLGLMAAAGIQLGQSAITDVFTLLIALVSLLVLIRFKISSVWLILVGAVLAGMRPYMGF